MADQKPSTTGAQRVLLVEDQPTLAEWVSSVLSEHDDMVLNICSSSRDAEQFAVQWGPTVILQDLVMPGMSGFDLLARYRAQASLHDVPVLVLTSIADVNEKVRAFELGAADYLVKLPHPVELVARVRAQSRAFQVRRERDHLTRELQLAMEMLFESNLKLARAAREDGLTGLGNRRGFDESLETEWRRAMRSEKPISLALIDLDFFKLYNDAYGHVRGDECLRTVATAVQGQARRSADHVARYGGEELCILLPETPEAGALQVAEGVRRAVLELALPHVARPDGLEWVTVSVGASTTVPKNREGALQLVEAADAALYAAKRRGKNTVVHTPLNG